MIQKDKIKTDSELKEFSQVMALAGLIFGGIMLWKGNGYCNFLFMLALFFLVFGVYAPKALRPVEKYWMKFAEKLSVVMTALIVSLTFIVAVTPLGFLLKLIGKELMPKTPDKALDSYWIPVPEDGPASRPYLPY